MTKLSRNLTITSKHPLIDFDLTASWLVLTQRIGSAWISNLKSLSQFAMYMYDSMAQVIIHVAYHCLIKNNTEWDKLHGWQVLWGDYDHSKSREDGSCPVLKKGKTTQNQKLKVLKIHQYGQTSLTKGFQAFEVLIWPVFLDDSVLSWCRLTDCSYLPPIIAIT